MRIFQTLTFLLFTTLLSHSNAQTAQNMSLIANWDPAGQTYNDIWGYVDGSGNEYAIIGSYTKVHFLNVTGATPTLVAEFTPGASSIWRDFKVFGHYAFASADQGSEGLLVFDLSGLPTSVSLVYQSTQFFSRAHNIYLDVPAARLYVAGSNTQNNGLIILDVSTPTNPTLLGSVNLANFGGPANAYVHDVHVRNNKAYCSHIYNSSLYIYDVTNAAAPVHLGHMSGYAEAGYNHSSWLNDAGTHLIFADETHGKRLKIMNVTNPANPVVNSLFGSDMLGLGTSIVHNPFIKGNFVYNAYYHEGVQVFDISDPAKVLKSAYYDTYPANTNYSGYQGCWGVYPYLPSGKIIASDISNGLFVLSMTCGAPIESVVTATNTEATIDWGGVLSATKYRVRYRPQGTTTWITQTSTPSKATLKWLFVGTTYEYQIGSYCLGAWSAYSATKTFATNATPGCTIPQPVHNILSATSVQISWNAMPGVTQFELNYKPAGGSWISVNPGTVNNVTLMGLTPGVKYTYRLRTKCGSVWTTWSLNKTFKMPASLIDDEPVGKWQMDSEPSGLERVEDFEIVPNPAGGQVIFNTSAEEKPTLFQIYNLLGEVQLEIPGELAGMPIHLGNFDNGVYWVKASFASTRTVSKKMMIVR